MKGVNGAPHPIDRIVGQNLANMRAFKGVTQNALAKRCENPITFQQVQKYEKGTNRITASRLVELAKALDCSVTDLFVGVGDELQRGTELPGMVAGRADAEAMREYRALSPTMQSIVRNLMRAMVKELTGCIRVHGGNNA